MTYSSEVLADSPLAYYRLGEPSGTTMTDSSGNGHDGTYAGSPGLGATGQLVGDADTAVNWDGSNDYGQVTYGSWMDASTAFSAVAIINPDTVSGDRCIIDRDHGGGRVFQWRMSGNKMQFIKIGGTGGVVTSTSVTNFSASTRYFVGVSYDGTNIRLYVNGTIDQTTSAAGTLGTGNSPLAVGMAWAGNSTANPITNAFDGIKDEVAIFGSVLSGTRFGDYYTAGTSTPPATVTHTANVPGVTSSFSVSVVNDLTHVANVPGVTSAFVLDAVPDTRTLTHDANVPGVTSAFTLLNTVTITHAANVPGVTSGFAIDSGAVLITHAANVPGVTSAFVLVAEDLGYYLTARNRTSGRQRDGVASWEWYPAVEPLPAHVSAAAQWVTALAFDEPVVVNGRPLVSVSTMTEIKHRHRIIIGGVDVTGLRGVVIPEMSYQLLEPGLYGPGALTLPQVYGYMEEPGEGDLSFLTDFARVVQQRVDDEGNVVSTDYKGFVVTYEITDDGLRIETGGELTGRLALTDKQIPLYRRVRDLGDQMFHLVNIHGCVMSPTGGPATGIETAVEGGTSSLDAFNRLNSLATTRTGAQFSTMPGSGGAYRFERKDLTTIHATCYAHDGQLPVGLRRDLSEEPSRVFGTGVTPKGLRVLNGVYPELALTTPAADYPMAGGGAFGIGTVNADTVNGDGITVLINRLHKTGFLGEVEDFDGYDEEVAEAVQSVQEEAGLAISVVGDMNQATWRALWDMDIVGYSMRGSQILPFAQKPYTRRWRRSGVGAVIGKHPHYDPSIPAVDRSIDFGTGFRKPQMVRWAKREIDQSEPNWVGTVNLETGALVAGDHTPGDPVTDIIHATSIRPGMNISLPLFMGGVVAHVSGVSVSGGSVSLSVDTRARDTLPVWEVIRRNRESRRNPHRAWVRDHFSSGNVSDSITEFSEAGGFIDDVPLAGGQWTAFPMVSGRSGTIGRIKIHTEEPTEFYMAIVGRGNKDGIEARFERRIGDPSTEEGAERWTDEDVLDDIDDANILLYVAGEPEAPCGYWPKKKGEAGTLTGKWHDDAMVEYRTDATNVLWVVVWAENDATIPGGRIAWPKLEPM